MVEKISFLFPGQGSQYVGMGKTDFDLDQSVKDLFSQANNVLGFDISKLMFEGSEEQLKDTAITQPALFLASAAALKACDDLSITPDWMAGHSLGEYSALYAAGVLTFEDALRLVQLRGKSMAEAAQKSTGAMAAIIGLSEEKCAEICASLNAEESPCVPANFNSDSQIVISGEAQAIQKAIGECEKAGASKVVLLNVSGAFHSPLMNPAVEAMRETIEKTSFQDARVPVLTNVDAEPTQNASQFKDKLLRQINHAVLWNKSAKKLIEWGSDIFIEVGSGRVLGSMMKRLDRKKKIFQTDDREKLQTYFHNLTIQQKGV